LAASGLAGAPGTNDSFAQQVVALVNQHRASLGLVALTTNATLTDSAVWKSRHMAAYAYFAHDDPAPPIARDPFTRMQNCGYASGGTLGENIAAGQQTPSVNYAVGGTSRVYAVLQPSTTYYFNVKNAAFGKSTCTSTTCNIFVELQKPNGL